MLKFSHLEDEKKETLEMCEKIDEKDPWQLEDILGHFKTQEMCKKAAEKGSRMLEYVPDHLKTQTM